MTKKKIMVIDDSAIICNTAEKFLSEKYQVVSVSNGFDALSSIIEEKPDLIFIDVIMPKLDGLQACRLIRRNKEFENTPIIFLSSQDGEFDKARGLFVGGTDYLTKPFHQEKILSLANLYLNK